MVLRPFITVVLALAFLMAGCGASNPATTLGECIMEGAEQLARSGNDRHESECEVGLPGPYRVVVFPPKHLTDEQAPQFTEAKALLASVNSPTHESIFVVSEDGKAKPWRQRNHVPVSQLFTVAKNGSKMTVVLQKTSAGIEVAELR
jgi:hypothetical protein